MESILDPLILKLLENTLREIQIINGCKNPHSGTGSPKKSNAQFKNSIIANKVQSDLILLEDLLTDIIKNCSASAEYKEVNQILEDIIKEYEEEYQILERFKQNKKLFRYLQNKWKKEKEQFKEKILKCDERIFELENDREEVGIEIGMKSRLVEKWEQARLEQTKERFQETYSEYEKALLATKQKYAKEVRIYNEIEVFTRHEIQSLTEEAENWNRKFDAELLRLDEEIKVAKVQIESTQDKTQALRDTYIQRNIEIETYLEQKQQLENSRALEKLQWESAVKIQAWWRGTMYRNGLGPYRRKKKPKKGKGGKKK